MSKLKKDLFISHSCKDKEMAEMFKNMLIVGLNIDGKRIYCSSLKGYDTPGGEFFVNDIRRKMLDSKIVIALMSKNYMGSQFCMSELGAAWYAKKLLPIVLPDLQISELKGVLQGMQLISAIDCSHMDDIQRKISNQYGVRNVINVWNSEKEKFVDVIGKMSVRVSEMSDNEKHLSKDIYESFIEIHSDKVPPILSCIDSRSVVKGIHRSLISKASILSSYSYLGFCHVEKWNAACGNVDYPLMYQGTENFDNLYKQLINDNFYWLDYLSLGVGTGDKDSSIMANSTNKEVRYFPVDISMPMISEGVCNVLKRHPKIRKSTFPIQIDFSNRADLNKISNAIRQSSGERRTRLVSVLGNTIANFDNDRLVLKNIVDTLLNEGDRIIFELATMNDDNLSLAKTEAEIEYSSVVFKDFAQQSLKHAVSLSKYSDWDKRIVALADYKVDLQHMEIEVRMGISKSTKMYFHSGNQVGGNENPRDIRLYLSRKYTSEGIGKLLSWAGLHLIDQKSCLYNNDVGFGCAIIIAEKKKMA